MKWKQEALDRLRKYDAMARALENIPQELRRLELAAQGIHSVRTDGIRGRGDREEAMVDNLLRRQALENALEQAKLWIATTDRALGALSPQEQNILQKMVMRPERGGLFRLCQELDCEQSSLYRKRDKALETFTVALYGIPESA